MNTINIQEGLDAINRIKLLMEQSISEQNKFEPETKYTWSSPNLATTSSQQTTKIDGTNISDLLLKVREFFLTPGGMTAQVVLSILGSEIGLPVVFSVIDVALIINDFHIMVSNWKDYTSKNEEEWFIYQYNNNKGFQYVIEDILLLLTGGVFRVVGKSAKSVYDFIIKKTGMSFSNIINKASEKILSKLDFNKLPTKIKEWCINKTSDLKRGLELLKKPTVATVVGAGTYKLGTHFEKQEELENSVYYNDFITKLTSDNPSIGKINQFKIISVDANELPTTVNINNKKYSITYEETPEKYIYKLNVI